MFFCYYSFCLRPPCSFVSTVFTSLNILLTTAIAPLTTSVKLQLGISGLVSFINNFKESDKCT